MSDQYYYRIAGLASENFDANRGLKKILTLSRKAEKILDVGCGEGTRLSLLSTKAKRFGVDVNRYAIKLAKNKYPEMSFKYYRGEELPFADKTFNLVYSAYVFEHTTDPYAVLDEMIRVTKKGGSICVITPNFGSPNRRSPNSTESKLTKLIKGFTEDILMPKRLGLMHVTPKKIYKQIDDDTTVEPYLRKIVEYGKQKRLKSVDSYSLWEIDEGEGIFWKILKRLGALKIYPFTYWGPQAFVWFEK